MSRLRRSISKRLRQRFGAAVSGALLGVATVGAAEPGAGNVVAAIQQEVQAVFEKCHRAIVRIEAIDNHGHLSGTGFFIDPNGTLYTSYTVGGESRDIRVAFGNERFAARRLVGDMRSGVAILKIDAETPFLPFGKAHDLAVASPVIAIGYPMDLGLTPAFGTVGGFDIKYLGRYFATTHIRANVAVQRGEGGAPLLNVKGEVVGILISHLDSGNASFVLPIEAAEKVRKDFVRFREVRPGWIGVHVKGADQPVEGSTAQVEEVIPDAPAKKAGLRAGDIFLQVGERNITSPEDLLDASFFMSAGDELTIRIARDGAQIQLGVTPVDPPDLMRPRLPALGSTGETAVPILTIDR
jgi:serine protease Do